MKNSIPHIVKIISYALIVNVLSGCGGGGGVRSDEGGSNKGAILGVALISGGIFYIRSNDESKQQSSNENFDLRESRFNPIDYNVYDKMTHIGNEPKGFGLNTYVLFGRRSIDEFGSKEKYTILLREIQSLPFWPAYSNPLIKEREDLVERPKIELDVMNIFLIPTNEGLSSKVVSLNDYNYDLSFYILREIFGAKADHEFNLKLKGEGPFLISTPKHIRDMNDLYVVYADMSDVTAENIPDIVKTFLDAISKGNKDNLNPFGLMENIRIQLAQRLINFSNVFQLGRNVIDNNLN